jgi:S1-C subfamily serine protease
VAELLPELRRDKGVVVATVSAAMPYSQQGKLEPGDVIYAVNGKAVDSVAALRTALGTIAANTAAVLQIERENTLMFLAFRIER